MKKILVLTDLSTNSKAGIRFAIQLQKQTGCSLIFFHAIEIMKPTSWNAVRYESFAAEKKAEFLEKLIAFVQTVYTREGGTHPANSFATDIGTDIPELTMGVARKVKAEAICLATRGQGKVMKLLGSVATSFLIKASLPIIIVPPKYKASPLTSVYYATDLEHFAAELKKVRTFAEHLNANLSVLYYDFLLMDEQKRKQMEARYSKYSSQGINLLFKKRNIDITLAECIRRDLKKDKPGLVVLFTKLSKGWLKRLFSVSRTEQLALHPTIPLLVFRKKEEA